EQKKNIVTAKTAAAVAKTASSRTRGERRMNRGTNLSPWDRRDLLVRRRLDFCAIYSVVCSGRRRTQPHPVPWDARAGLSFCAFRFCDDGHLLDFRSLFFADAGCPDITH